MEEGKYYTLSELKDKKVITIPEWMNQLVSMDETAVINCKSFNLQFITWKKYLSYCPCHNHILSAVDMFNNKSVLVLNQICKAYDSASEVLSYMDDVVNEDGYIEDDYTMSDEEIREKYGINEYNNVLLCMHDDLWQLDQRLAKILEKPEIRYQSRLPQIDLAKRRIEGYKNVLLKYEDKIHIYRGYINHHLNSQVYDDGEYLSNYGSYDEPDSKDYEQDYYASASLFISPYYCSNQLARKINKALEASDSLFELL